MRCRFASVPLLAVCWLSGSAWANGLNLIQNGTFLAGTVATQFCNSASENPPNACATDNLPVDWGNDPPSPESTSAVNVVTPSSEPILPPTGYSGDYLAYTSSTDPNVSQDCIYQWIDNTVPGQMYTLTFDLAIVGSSSGLIMIPDWDAFGTNRQQFFGLGNGLYSTAGGGAVVSSGTQAFQPFSFSVEASSTQTILFFHGVDNSGALLLANVSLTQDSVAPEPAPWWLLGTGLMLMLGVRHKRFLQYRK